MALFRCGGNSSKKLVIPSMRCSSDYANNQCKAILDMVSADNPYNKITIEDVQVVNMSSYEIIAAHVLDGDEYGNKILYKDGTWYSHECIPNLSLTNYQINLNGVTSAQYGSFYAKNITFE